MPSPTSSSATSIVRITNSLTIDALISGVKWGGATGTGAFITYSFPWTSSETATFSGPDGFGDYSTSNEHQAKYHFGLNEFQQNAAGDALQAWAKVANLTFLEVADTSTDVGEIRFAFSSAVNPWWGWAWEPSSYFPSGGDIWICDEQSGGTSADWSSGSSNFQALLHEIGHALGLKHPFVGVTMLPDALDNKLYTVMAYQGSDNNLYPSAGWDGGEYGWLSYEIQPNTPMILDIAAIQYIYGANNNYNTGNDIYVFDEQTPFFTTIWDAGGNDTISASNYHEPCIINLEDGSYSSLGFAPPFNNGGVAPTYDGSNNLGIAINCFIENAIGGDGDDTLIGNELANNLQGGGGDDTVTGGIGKDTFIVDAGTDNIADFNIGSDFLSIYVNAKASIVVTSEGKYDFSHNVNNYGTLLVDAAGTGQFSLLGTSGDDILSGSSNQDSLSGDAGNDILVGEAGNDTLKGGLGDDSLTGGVGKDTFIVDAGSDNITDFNIGNDFLSIHNDAKATIFVTSEGKYEFLNCVTNGGILFVSATGTGKFSLLGTSGDDILSGSSSQDTLSGEAGNDILAGGSGIDTALFQSNHANFHLGMNDNYQWTVSSVLGGLGADTFSSIERLQFTDHNVALDLDGNAGMVAKILGAVFGPDAVSDQSFVGIGLFLADGGMGYGDLSQLAIDVSGAVSPEQIVNLLWTNVVGSAPTFEQVQPFVDMLNNGMTTGDLTILAAETDLNKGNINLLGLAQTGLEYIAWS